MIIKWFIFVVVLLDLVVSNPLLSETPVQHQSGDALLDAGPSKRSFQEVEERMYHWTMEDVEEMCHIWPGSVVSYENITKIDADVWSAIERAMKLISSLTCVKFEPVGSEMGQPHLKIKQTDGFDCSSPLGRQCMDDENNLLQLSNKCAPLFGYALKSWLSTLGIHPQHLRNDRDDYVTILKNNIPESLIRLFDEHNKTMQERKYGDYDYCSITHCASNIWSKTKEDPTIVTRDPLYQSVIGQMEGLSFGDIELINNMYGCSDSCPLNLTCKGNCYMNANCKCFCPKKLSGGECELYTEPNQMPAEEEPIEKDLSTVEEPKEMKILPMMMMFNSETMVTNDTKPMMMMLNSKRMVTTDTKPMMMNDSQPILMYNAKTLIMPVSQGSPTDDNTTMHILPVYETEDSNTKVDNNSMMELKPAVMAQQPDVMTLQPAVMTPQPDVMTPKPDVMAPQPDVMAPQPGAMPPTTNYGMPLIVMPMYIPHSVQNQKQRIAKQKPVMAKQKQKKQIKKKKSKKKEKKNKKKEKKEKKREKRAKKKEREEKESEWDKKMKKMYLKMKLNKSKKNKESAKEKMKKATEKEESVEEITKKPIEDEESAEAKQKEAEENEDSEKEETKEKKERERSFEQKRKRRKGRRHDIITTVEGDGTLEQIHLITHKKNYYIEIENKHPGKEVYIFKNAKEDSEKTKLKFRLNEYDFGEEVTPCKSYFTLTLYPLRSVWGPEKFCGKKKDSYSIYKLLKTAGNTATIEVHKDGTGGKFFLKGKVKPR